MSITSHQAASSAHQVDDHVFISGYLAAADPEFVRANGFARIVKLFADDASYPGGYHRHADVRYFVAPAEDVAEYDIRPAAARAVQFIQEGIQRGERVLVHCHMGISRSATVVLFHLMINRRLPLADAYALLREIRPIVQPNPGFMRHLLATDARLRVKARTRTSASIATSAAPPVAAANNRVTPRRALAQSPLRAPPSSAAKPLSLLLGQEDERGAARLSARAGTSASKSTSTTAPPANSPLVQPPDPSAWSFKE